MVGAGAKVELTFDPGDLGRINVLDPQTGQYVSVPALDQVYAKGLSLWQHKVIRRYAQRQLNARTDIVALAQAKAEIRALVERDVNRKSTHSRKRHARFLEDHASGPAPAVAARPVRNGNPGDSGDEQVPAEASRGAEETRPDVFTDDEALPAFESSLDLPRVPAGAAGEAPETQQGE